MAKETIFWYDLETFGTDPYYDRIAQFAGIRTNTDLEPIEEPVVIYCRITDDYLPDPLACLVTGITPQQTIEKGRPESEFIAAVHDHLSRPATCTAGFNSVRFDDEFIRNALYRNFFDPYLREYANGNSRWDIIDALRAAHDLRPAGISWMKHEDGRPSFRLEAITHANGISHTDAHDALGDVRATIETARLLRSKQPELYAYAFSLRNRSTVKEKINLFRHTPVLHTSAVHTTIHGCTAMVVPLSVDPLNSNSIIAWNLSLDPQPLFEAAPDALFTKEVPLVRIALNKIPFIAPIGTLTDEAAEHLQIDRKVCRDNLDRILERRDLPNKLRSAMQRVKTDGVSDPDFQIYSGGFFSDEDRERFQIIRSTPPEKLPELNLRFQDSRVPEMLWRYIARSYPEILGPEDQLRWRSFAAGRILFPPGDRIVNLQFYRRKIDEKILRTDISPTDKQILRQLANYADDLEKRLFHHDG